MRREDKCQYWGGNEAQRSQWNCPGSHSPLVAESRAGTMIFGELAYSSYINTMPPLNYMWKVRLIYMARSENKVTPVIGFSLCSLSIFREGLKLYWCQNLLWRQSWCVCSETSWGGGLVGCLPHFAPTYVRSDSCQEGQQEGHGNISSCYLSSTFFVPGSCAKCLLPLAHLFWTAIYEAGTIISPFYRWRHWGSELVKPGSDPSEMDLKAYTPFF